MVYFHKKEVLLSLPFSSSSLLLLLLHYAFGQVGQLPPTERLSSATDLAALFALRSSLGVRSINWPRKADPCLAWNGVGCVAGRVVRLDLSGLRRTRLGRLSPRFAVDGLGNLTRLIYFNSTGFALPGPIPDWFGQRLGPLQILDLSSSSVFGSIPLSLGNLTQLTHLHLSGNALTGAIPESFALFSHLLELNLSHNSLYGSIPPTLATLQNLTILDLSANFFGDSIPPVLGTLASLQTLILANNSLIGSIPAQLGNLSLLVDLDLRFNSLTEAVPADLGGLSNLKRLMLGNNGLSGSLPANLFSSLTQLQFLVLGHNDFSGILPNRLWSLSKLKFIDISFNNFTGNLPDPSSTSNGSAAFFNLSNNFFYGSWPSQFERFNFIDLSGNYLEGTILDVGNLNASYDLNCLQNASNQRSLEDCRSFYASRGLNFDGFGAPAPEPTQPSAPKRRTNRNLKFILIGVFGGLAFIALLVILVVLILRIQRRRGADQRGVSVNQVASGEVGSPSTGITINFSSLGEPFTYEQLLRATADFGDCNLIKKGHSGDLYQGILEGGTPIVVKRVDLKKFKKDGYMVELDLFSRATHSRLVPFLGHCLEHENDKLLVYKYMPNGNLSDSLYRKSNSEEDGLQSLDWITRLKIATGAAEALSYLHHECSPPLVHSDVEASSIFLDDKFEVHLGSLSEVRTQEGDGHQNVISRLLRFPQTSEPGSLGSQSATCAYDVYCLGKVLLELVTGKLGISGSNDANTNEWLESVLHFISPYEKELVTKIVDPTLIVDEDLLEEVWAMAIVAKTCLNPRPAKRPLMRYILKALENPLKVVREENTGSARLRTTSSRGSWNAAFFGSWHHSSSDIVGFREGANLKPSGAGGSHGSRHGGDLSSSHKRLSKEIFPEPPTVAQEMEKPDEN